MDKKHLFDSKDYVFMPRDVYEKFMRAVNNITIVAGRSAREFDVAYGLLVYSAKALDGENLQKVLDKYVELVNKQTVDNSATD